MNNGQGGFRMVTGLIGGLCLFLLQPVARAFAAEDCITDVAPLVEVTTSDSTPRFDYSLSQKKMGAFAQSTQLPAGDIYDLTVNALSTGTMRIDQVIKFKGQKLPQDQVCVQVSKVLIDIHIDPVIYIASELHDEGCEFKEYYLHEMKHVEEDRRLIEDYKEIVRRNLAFAFPGTADYNIGPVSARETEASRAALQESVQGALEATFGSMLRERKDRQRAIDSAGEFMRLSHVCGEGGAGVKPELRR